MTLWPTIYEGGQPYMLQPDLSEHSYQQSEQFVQSALDALSAHIAILDEIGQIIGVNAAWCDFADGNDYDGAHYAVGSNYLNICDAATGRNSREAPAVAKGIRAVLANELPEFRLEYPCHSPEEKRWFVVHVTRFDWSGKPRVIVAHQNVTELKEVQVELADSQRRIQTILDNVINGIVTLDSRGVIESINPAGAAIFDYDMADLFGQSVEVLLAEGERGDSIQALLKRLQNGGHHEIQGVRRDGSTFSMYFAISRVVVGTRRIYTGIIQDVTDRKQIEMERIEKEKLALELDKERELRDLRNRFISMMSHELRTPLASIMLSSDLLKKYSDRIPPDERDQYIDNINAQVALLTDLIREVSTVNRSQGGVTRTISPQRIDLVTYCRDLADEYRLTNQGVHTLIFSSQYEHLYAMADPKLMRQVVGNLISNALKYTPAGGEVIVYVSNGGRYVTIRVSDNGIGIPKEDRVRLFEPFHRASNAQNMPGTGLGLTIARQAVELHGGTIKVESQVNVGTSVIVSLPIHMDTI